jgi:phosphatidate phosphatase APP1
MRHAVLLFLALLLGAPATARAAPGLLLMPALGRTDVLVVAGRVYTGAPGRGSSSLSRNLRRLAASEWEGAPVEVRFAGARVTGRSGEDGAFALELRPADGARFPEGLGEAQVDVPGASARLRVEIVSDAAPFLVISDFDDTVAVTNVLSHRRLARAALLQDADTQPAVPGMSAFYGCLRGREGGTPSFALVSGSPIQYVVSGSPIQYADRVGHFLALHGFPHFGLHLRNLGPGTLRGYKQPLLRQLLRRFPHPVVLVGDSGEQDPEVYAEIRREFPGRVRAVYIRDAGRTQDRSRFEGMTLFREPRQAAQHAAGLGLLDAPCVERALPLPQPVPPKPAPAPRP